MEFSIVELQGRHCEHPGTNVRDLFEIQIVWEFTHREIFFK